MVSDARLGLHLYKGGEKENYLSLFLIRAFVHNDRKHALIEISGHGQGTTIPLTTAHTCNRHRGIFHTFK